MDECNLSLDGTSEQSRYRSFCFYNPHPGTSANKSSYVLSIVVGGMADGEMIPPHFQLLI